MQGLGFRVARFSGQCLGFSVWVLGAPGFGVYCFTCWPLVGNEVATYLLPSFHARKLWGRSRFGVQGSGFGVLCLGLEFGGFRVDGFRASRLRTFGLGCCSLGCRVWGFRPRTKKINSHTPTCCAGQ